MEARPQTPISLLARWGATYGVWLGLLGLAALAAWMAWVWSERNGYAQLDDAAARQLDLYAAVLENELGKQAYLPGLLEADRDIEALLRHPANLETAPAVNRMLARFSVTSGAANTFVLDAGGRVVASGDWYRPDTVWKQDFSARPYVVDALRGEESRFFAPNPDSGASEYYFAQPVVRGDKVLGVVAVRISLAAMEATWVELAFRAESEKPLVADANGVVILSSVPDWKFKTTSPLPAAERARVAGLGVYPKDALAPLPMAIEQQLDHGVQLARLRISADAAPKLNVIHERSLDRFGWRLLIFSDVAEVWRNARYAAWGAAAMTAFVGLLFLYLLQRRRAVAQRLTARTAELLAMSNRELQHEITERRHTEAVLRHAQEELVQAEKLALLGQMSAGISHEIGQPLTALLALSENARLLLARGRHDSVAENLVSISAVVERMGRITGQLKSFARKSSAPSGSITLGLAIANVQNLLQVKLRSAQVEVAIDIPADLQVRCDGNRLEQVLVNLAGNAVDAMRASQRKRLTVKAWPEGGRAVVRISDTGPGIPPALHAHLFEPFFTTKPPGEGLGLGLVISAHIVKEFGGTLRSVPVDEGAAFEFDLQLTTMAVSEQGEESHV